ncbi:hypothetical protein [Pseudomonas sp. NY15374]|uniref:hypothetical protein n=1 Tax=Pseudomonas sp. NY15374 TaxID=3400357 RepID=UPI003A8644DF
MNPSIDLEAAQAAFFASGGQIIVLEGFTYQPLPPRRRPKPKKKPAKVIEQKAPTDHASKVRARVNRIAELAKTMTCTEVANLLGESKGAMWGVAAREGFRFFSPPKPPRPVVEKPGPSLEDRELADKIIALRDEGRSRCGVTVELGIGNCRLVRLLALFDIDFPIRRDRGRR